MKIKFMCGTFFKILFKIILCLLSIFLVMTSLEIAYRESLANFLSLIICYCLVLDMTTDICLLLSFCKNGKVMFNVYIPNEIVFASIPMFRLLACYSMVDSTTSAIPWKFLSTMCIAVNTLLFHIYSILMIVDPHSLGSGQYLAAAAEIDETMFDKVDEV